MNARTAGLVAVALAITAWVWISSMLQGPTAAQESATEAAHRVVSLDPGITEVVIRLGASDRLVARPDHSDGWPELAALPTVGTGLTPNYEGIVRTQPDLILTSGTRGAVLADLESIAPTLSVPWLTVPDVVDGIRLIGTVLERTTAAEQLAQEMELGLRSTVHEGAPRVLLLIGAPSNANPDLWYISHESLHGAALAAAGGRNAIDSTTRGTPSISLEHLLEVDPDVVLIMLSQPEVSNEELARHRQFWDKLDMISAVRNERVDFIVGKQHFSIGPGVLDLAAALRTKLDAPGEGEQ